MINLFYKLTYFIIEVSVDMSEETKEINTTELS